MGENHLWIPRLRAQALLTYLWHRPIFVVMARQYTILSHLKHGSPMERFQTMMWWGLSELTNTTVSAEPTPMWSETSRTPIGKPKTSDGRIVFSEHWSWRLVRNGKYRPYLVVNFFCYECVSCSAWRWMLSEKRWQCFHRRKYHHFNHRGLSCTVRPGQARGLGNAFEFHWPKTSQDKTFLSFKCIRVQVPPREGGTKGTTYKVERKILVSTRWPKHLRPTPFAWTCWFVFEIQWDMLNC